MAKNRQTILPIAQKCTSIVEPVFSGVTTCWAKSVKEITCRITGTGLSHAGCHFCCQTNSIKARETLLFPLQQVSDPSTCHNHHKIQPQYTVIVQLTRGVASSLTFAMSRSDMRSWNMTTRGFKNMTSSFSGLI